MLQGAAKAHTQLSLTESPAAAAPAAPVIVAAGARPVVVALRPAAAAVAPVPVVPAAAAACGAAGRPALALGPLGELLQGEAREAGSGARVGGCGARRENGRRVGRPPFMMHACMRQPLPLADRPRLGT